jgi:ABC-type multidrug transport system fused ATPase/permease subunit
LSAVFEIQLLHYGDLRTEAEPRLAGDPNPSWPPQGSITFDNVELCYRPELPMVLRGISFDVKAGEKVGALNERVLSQVRVLTVFASRMG